MHALLLPANFLLKFNPQEEKKFVLPNTAWFAAKTAGTPLFDYVLKTSVRSALLKL